MLTAYAAATSRIRLGTGVVPIYTRTPATMAQTAATLDEQSGGRLRLGPRRLAPRRSSRAGTARRSTSPWPRCASTSAIVRAILRGEAPPPGEKWQTSFALSGIGPGPDLPIYVAALSPAMLRLAGEVADGVMLWLCNPEYIRDVVVPEVTRRARARRQDARGLRRRGRRAVGRRRRPGPALATMRRDLLTYFGLPFYRAMIERSGFERRHRRLRRGRRARRRRGDAGARSPTTSSTR